MKLILNSRSPDVLELFKTLLQAGMYSDVINIITDYMKNPKDKEKAKQLESVMKESLKKAKETLGKC